MRNQNLKLAYSLMKVYGPIIQINLFKKIKHQYLNFRYGFRKLSNKKHKSVKFFFMTDRTTK